MPDVQVERLEPGNAQKSAIEEAAQSVAILPGEFFENDLSGSRAARLAQGRIKQLFGALRRICSSLPPSAPGPPEQPTIKLRTSMKWGQNRRTIDAKCRQLVPAAVSRSTSITKNG
jgi:hypothetical protein